MEPRPLIAREAVPTPTPARRANGDEHRHLVGEQLHHPADADERGAVGASYHLTQLRVHASVPIYLAWTSQPPTDLVGPWEEARTAAPGLLLIDSTASLSAVYHAVKWSLPQEAALIVSVVQHTPKSRGLSAGIATWLRARTTPPSS
ncbi:hypothetical protein [Pseudonocardia sp. NPDC049154]|uniref:hypothetical protein n=1 Tax=Pseudonocardia sp. NPDC049154 TaxID=3155501 RepID=UPI0033DA73F8